MNWKNLIIELCVIFVLFMLGNFISYHKGIEKGKGLRGDYVYMDCTPTEGSEEFVCDMWELNTPELIEAYEKQEKVCTAILKEIRKPSDKQTWQEKYTEWEERKLGL